MKKIKVALACFVIAGGIGSGIAVAQHQLKAVQELDASTEPGALEPNISLERKTLDWDCDHVTNADPCYYTWSEATNSYSIPSSERGPFVDLAN